MSVDRAEVKKFLKNWANTNSKPHFAVLIEGRWGILIACSWPLAIVFSRIAVLFPDSSGLLRFIRELQGISWSKTIGLLFLITFVIGNPIALLINNFLVIK